MFANRYTAFIDACRLASTRKRNLLCSLAEAEFFRIRWSAPVLEETQRAIQRILEVRGFADAAQRAVRARSELERAFEDALVTDFDSFFAQANGLPDTNDVHVLAAALKTQASTIVTENLRHFPPDFLAQLNLEARSSDAFIADTISLDPGRAVAAVARMRKRYKKPAMTAEAMLIDMEADGLPDTVDILRNYVDVL